MISNAKRRRSSSPSDFIYRPSTTAVTLVLLLSSSNAFVPIMPYRSTNANHIVVPQSQHHHGCCYSSFKPSSLRMSSIGGGGGRRRDNDDDDNALNKWMRGDSNNNNRNRDGDDSSEINPDDYRLPISYGALDLDDEEETSRFGPLSSNNTSSSLARSSSSNEKSNPYLNVVSRLTPSDLISRFTSTASPRVQDAVRTTILGLIGGLPQMAFETKTIATGERLASLMFQLQMTGYMFKNAEYRMSLSQSLENSSSSKLLLPTDSKREWRDGVRKVKGKIKVRYGNNDDGGGDPTTTTIAEDSTSEEVSNNTVSNLKTPLEVQVDAETYMIELRREVARLREELEEKKLEKEEEIRKDLLLYIRTLPPRELKELTSTMSPEVLDAMKGLVTAVLAGIGDEDGNEDVMGIGLDTVTEQSGESLAELCMWQLVVGFNLRELEVREGFKSSLKGLLGEGGEEESDGTNDQFGTGAFE
eukprot:scaffold48121_cov54-Cyclotella_meneghiniana.AAC.7